MHELPVIIHVVGNRPQFVKLAVMYDCIKRQTLYPQFIIHTGQHFSPGMSGVFFDELHIPEPDILFSDLDVEDFTASASHAIQEVLKERPSGSVVLVYGDTNSTLAAALAAARNGNPLFHFESGVRTFVKSMPEEINRILTDRLSDVHFCCTPLNVENLEKEGYGTSIPGSIVRTGDLMLDAFRKIKPSEKNPFNTKDYVLCTIHRAGNILSPDHLSEIVAALNEIHREVEVVIPLHPHTEKMLQQFGLQLNCTISKPLGYNTMKSVLADASYVITDSGGTCREAFFSCKRSLVIMEHPFWPEIVGAGAALNCPPEKQKITNLFYRLPQLKSGFDSAIFGDGRAAEKIAEFLNSLF